MVKAETAEQALGGLEFDFTAACRQFINCRFSHVAVSGERRLPDVCDMHHAILENAEHAIIATNVDGTILYINRAGERLLGYSSNELIGRHTPALFHLPEEVAERARELSEELDERIDAGFEVFVARPTHGAPELRRWTYRHKDGRRIPVMLSVSALRDTEGRITGYLGIASDDSERIAFEREMRIAATAFESQAAIMVTDAQQRILSVNRAFTLLTGYTPEETIGRTPSMLNSGKQDAAYYREMWRALQEDGHWQGEIWNRRKNGEVYPEWLTITTVRDGEGEVTNYVSTFSDITELKRAESEILELAFQDSLTQLPNRRTLIERLQRSMTSSARNLQYGALLLLDLDNFKKINDTDGHDAGDRLLIDVAQRLLSCVREGDTVARLGGDEFVVLLEGLSIDTAQAGIQAEAIAEKIRSTLAGVFHSTLGHDYETSCSIGINLFRGQAESIDTLLKQADVALYHAKGAGRNTARFFDAAMQASIDSRTRLEAELRKAVDRHELSLYLQPQSDADGAIVGAEALLRWQPRGRPIVTPGDFIPLAEETGLILPIGQWVLDSACALLGRWDSNRNTRFKTLAVNVSARQFRQPDFVEQVRSSLERHGVAPARLKLELTESLLLDNVDATIAKMESLKALGVSFSLDDFGTGYASLSYLKRLPFAQLKLDRSFVHDLERDGDARAIVEAIIGMSRTLRLEMVAEGVETEAQRSFLERFGCKTFQGYLFGRPVPLEEFEALLEEQLES